MFLKKKAANPCHLCVKKPAKKLAENLAEKLTEKLDWKLAERLSAPAGGQKRIPTPGYRKDHMKRNPTAVTELASN